MAEALAELREVTCAYRRIGKTPLALSSVSCFIARGVLVGVVGSNGAGKTTLARVLLGQLPPLSGSVWRDPSVRWAFLPDASFLVSHLPAKAYLGVLGGTRARFAEYVERLGASGWAMRPGRGLSTGQRRRLELALVLAGQGEALVLDEPTAGLDAWGVQTLTRILLEEKSRGRTLVVTSGLRSGLEEAFDYWVVLKEGKLVFSGWRQEVPGELLGLALREAVRSQQQEREGP